MGKFIFRLAVVALGVLASLAVVGCFPSEPIEKEPTPIGSNNDGGQDPTLTGPDVIQMGWDHEPPLENSSRRIIDHQKVDGECRWASGSTQGSKVVRRLAVDQENCRELIEEGTLSGEGRRYQAAERAAVEAYMKEHPEMYDSESMDAEPADQTPGPDVDGSEQREMVDDSGAGASQPTFSATAVVVAVAVKCSPDVPVTPDEVLDKARKAMKALSGYHVEYDYHIVRKESTDEGVDIIVEGVVVADFQAPDRMRLRGGMVSRMTPGVNLDKEFDEIWIGNVQYLKNPLSGRWRTITYPEKYVQAVNKIIDISPDSFRSLECTESDVIDGHELFKLIGTAPPGVYLEFYDAPPEVRVEYYIGKDDYLFRKFVFDAESYDDFKSHTVTYRFSAFDSPATIDIPEVAPPTPP